MPTPIVISCFDLTTTLAKRWADVGIIVQWGVYVCEELPH